jgi:hypothetical protein
MVVCIGGEKYISPKRGEVIEYEKGALGDDAFVCCPKEFVVGKNESTAKFGAWGCFVDINREGKKVKLTPPKIRAETIARVIAITILFFCVLIAVPAKLF